MIYLMELRDCVPYIKLNAHYVTAKQIPIKTF